MSVAGRGFGLAKSPCTEVPSSIWLYLHSEVSAPATGTGWVWAVTTSGCQEADLPPQLMGLEPWAVASRSSAHLTSPSFLCRSLNGATDIREFPDLKGTTSLEVL